jgi:hypothetical protein
MCGLGGRTCPSDPGHAQASMYTRANTGRQAVCLPAGLLTFREYGSPYCRALKTTCSNAFLPASIYLRIDRRPCRHVPLAFLVYSCVVATSIACFQYGTLSRVARVWPLSMLEREYEHAARLCALPFRERAPLCSLSTLRTESTSTVGRCVVRRTVRITNRVAESSPSSFSLWVSRVQRGEKDLKNLEDGGYGNNSTQNFRTYVYVEI